MPVTTDPPTGKVEVSSKGRKTEKGKWLKETEDRRMKKGGRDDLGRDWLAKHDPAARPKLKKRRGRWQVRRQERMRERLALARPLLKGV
jgi:hypothetical protein